MMLREIPYALIARQPRMHLLLIVLQGLLTCAFTEADTYRLYNGKTGKPLELKKMARKLRKADVVLFGETHNSVVDHQLQIRLVELIFERRGQSLVLGAEMFETDDQLILDEYLGGVILEKHLMAEAKTWNNYETDYAPLVRFSKQHGLSFVATNVPRRYASLVAREGLESLEHLSEDARRLMAPLPFTVDMDQSLYRQMLSMMMGHPGKDIDPERMVEAQALKDATMAHFILKNLPDRAQFVHINGSFHSDQYQGIVHYLLLSDPDIDIVTIKSVQQETIGKLDKAHHGKADFVLVLSPEAPKSY